MSKETSMTFHLPKGWTLRKVATALVKEWLPPFRAEPAAKAARWVVQPVMESTEASDSPLWEPGISTEEYEERLDRANLSWAIRATAGRGKGIILARLVSVEDQPDSFQLVGCQPTFPESLFDREKLSEISDDGTPPGPQELFAAVLASHGFEAEPVH
ncbi:MAG: hypothetical protein ACOY93_04750 [Bacillota bacterium]